MKDVTHLTETGLRQLLDGSLPAEEARRLASHLAGECRTCEELLASRPVADAADGLVDEVLAAAWRRAASGNDFEFARIDRRLAGRAPERRRFRAAGLVAAALALAGAAGLLVARAPRRPGWDGVKGAAPVAAPVRLRFLVIEQGGGEPRVEKGMSGQTVPAEASLQFEIDSARAADVAVLRLSPGGQPEVFFRQRVPAGRSLVSAGGRPAAYPLAGAGGRQRFAVIASPGQLAPGGIAHAAAALSSAGAALDAPGLEGLSVDVVEVEVR